MKRIAFLMGCALAAAACTSQEDQLENAMRETLSSRGNVQEVEMTRQDGNSMTGYAVVVNANGQSGRLNCTAARNPSKGENYYDWRCAPAIDEALLSQMEETIRQSLSRQGEVIEVDLRRQDDNRMTGFARVRDGNGNEIRAACAATRDNDEAGNFSWRCGEGAADQAAEGDK